MRSRWLETLIDISTWFSCEMIADFEVMLSVHKLLAEMMKDGWVEVSWNCVA